MEIVIRPFQPGDMDGLYFLDQNCHDAEARLPYGRLLGTLLEKDVAAVVAAEIAEGMDSTRLAGALMARSEPCRGRLCLLRVMVHPNLRRLGIARRLVDWAIRIGRGSGFRELALAEEDSSDEARAILTALGFAPAEEAISGLGTNTEVPCWIHPLNTGEAP